MKFLIIVFIFLSCGDSPFLNKDSSKNESKKSEFNSSIIFDKSRSTLRDSAGTKLGIGKYKLSAVWGLGPSTSFENNLILIISNHEGERVDIPLEFEIYLWMPGMGHGSFPVSIERISSGVYEISEIFFTMDGYWDLHIGFLDNKELIEEVKWPIDL